MPKQFSSPLRSLISYQKKILMILAVQPCWMKTCTQFTSNEQCSKPCHHWGYFTPLIGVLTPFRTGRGVGAHLVWHSRKTLTILMMAYYISYIVPIRLGSLLSSPIYGTYSHNFWSPLNSKKTSAASRLQSINEGPKHTRTERQSRKMGTEKKQPDKVVLIFWLNRWWMFLSYTCPYPRKSRCRKNSCILNWMSFLKHILNGFLNCSGNRS